MVANKRIILINIVHTYVTMGVTNKYNLKVWQLGLEEPVLNATEFVSHSPTVFLFCTHVFFKCIFFSHRITESQKSHGKSLPQNLGRFGFHQKSASMETVEAKFGRKKKSHYIVYGSGARLSN